MEVIWITLWVVVGAGIAIAVYHNWPKLFGKVADTAANSADQVIDKAKKTVKKKTG